MKAYSDAEMISSFKNLLAAAFETQAPFITKNNMEEKIPSQLYDYYKDYKDYKETAADDETGQLTGEDKRKIPNV